MKNLSLLSLIGMFLMACQSDVKQNKIIIKKELLSFRQDLQFFTIDSQKDTIFSGLNGTVIFLAKDCFSDAKGPITIELMEFYDIPNMLLQGLTTTSNGFILESDGMIYLNAKDVKGNDIKLNASKCEIKMPKKNNGMSLFYGEINSKSKLNWIQDTLSFYFDTIPPSAVFNEFSIDRLGWINADKFLKVEKKTDLTVQTINKFENITYSLVFNKFNTILPAIPDNEGKLNFKGIPDNENVSLIALGFHNGKYYYECLDLKTNSKNSMLKEIKVFSKREIQKELTEKFGTKLG